MNVNTSRFVPTYVRTAASTTSPQKIVMREATPLSSRHSCQVHTRLAALVASSTVHSNSSQLELDRQVMGLVAFMASWAGLLLLLVIRISED